MADDEFWDAAQISVRYGISRSRLSEWHKDRDRSGFPGVDHVVGRRQFWAADLVQEWFARRTGAADEAAEEAASAAVGDPNDLLSAADVAALLGYRNVSTIHKYRGSRPGYFPEPDWISPRPEGRGGRPTELWWRRGTIITWMRQRPGKGNRASSRTPPEQPKASPQGDPDELLAAPQAAAILGYTSADSFISALAQGKLPGLSEPDAMQPGTRGGPRRLWRRSKVIAVAARKLP